MCCRELLALSFYSSQVSLLELQSFITSNVPLLPLDQASPTMSCPTSSNEIEGYEGSTEGARMLQESTQSDSARKEKQEIVRMYSKMKMKKKPEEPINNHVGSFKIDTGTRGKKSK